MSSLHDGANTSNVSSSAPPMAALPPPSLTPVMLPGALPMVDGMTSMPADGTWMGLGEQGTPGKSGAAPGLLPAFGMREAAHLPTPQSPSNAALFNPTLQYPSGSPMTQRLPPVQQPHFPFVAGPPTIHSHIQLQSGLANSQAFMTPDASPVYSRRQIHSQDQSPHLSNVAALLSSPFTPRPLSQTAGTQSHPAPSRSGKEPMNALTADTLTLSPPRSRDITPASSNLGSPFGGHRPSLNDRSQTKMKTPARSQAATPMAAPPVPAPSQDNVSAATPSQTPPPLSAPVPQRPLGGEIERIKAQMVVDQAARATETEARRPDYLVRAQRPGSGQIKEPVDVEDPDGNPGLGVTVTPMRGRRIQLFQETSEESFEQSLLAGGYPGYGSMAAEPQTPVPGKPNGNISQRMLQWFSQATPGQPGPSSAPTEPEEDWVPSEKEIRKRKRLAAFEEEKDPNDHNTRLHPVEIANKGRILITVSPEELPPEITATLQTPTKKRPNPRRRRRGHRRGRGGSPGDDDELDGPNWVDASFPWCTRLQERKDILRMAKEERLRWIESYFEDDSDLTSTDDEGMRHSDQSLQPAIDAHDDDEEVRPLRRGRGKMVPLNANPEARSLDARPRKNVLIPSDPADARAALLSKRSVRSLAERRRRREEDEESSDEVNCPCGRGENGKPCVQCDDCKCWFHLKCMGIRSEAELGADDDPWYCPDCLGIPSSDPLSEPTFVPTDNELPRDGLRDPLLYQGSPRTPYNASRRDPRTPTQTRERSEVYDSRSSWNSSGAGPVTPLSSQRDVAVYKTPTFDSPFNPADTPSRGKFAFSSPWADEERWHLTPRDPSIWKHGGLHDIASDRRTSIPGYTRGSGFDDTPVLRNLGREDIAMVGRRLWASPTSPAPSFRRSSLQGRTDLSMTPGAKVTGP